MYKFILRLVLGKHMERQGIERWMDIAAKEFFKEFCAGQYCAARCFFVGATKQIQKMAQRWNK